MREEAGVGGLAQGEEQPDLLERHVQPVGELGDVPRHQRGRGLRDERQPDVGQPEHLAGQRAGRLTDLHAEHQRTELAHHRGGVERAAAHPRRQREALGQLARELVGERGGQGGGHGRRDRLGERPPRRQRLLDPLGAGQGAHPAAGGRQVGRGVEPELGDAERVRGVAGLGGADGRVAALHGDLPRQVVRDVPVHGAVPAAREHPLHLGDDLVHQRRVVRQAGGPRHLGRVEALLPHLAQRLVRVGAEHLAQHLLPGGSARGLGLARVVGGHAVLPGLVVVPP